MARETHLLEFRLEKGPIGPKHSETGYMVSGVSILPSARRYPAIPGDSWCIPGNKEHHAVAHWDSRHRGLLAGAGGLSPRNESLKYSEGAHVIFSDLKVLKYEQRQEER